MAKSAFLKSSIAKKYWMALTGVFLCLFLVGHLVGNLQMLSSAPDAALKFNQYALFMTTNPFIKIMSYITYLSIIFHAIDGIILTIQNKKARPVGYHKENAAANSSFASRNMAVLGTLILVFIVMHMSHFWAKMHFDKNMPLQTIEVENMGQKFQFYTTTIEGKFFPADTTQLSQMGLERRDIKYFYDKKANIKMGEGYKDLHKITVAFFKGEKIGLWATLGYVLAMVVLGFHLWHGFASAFQSLGINNPKCNSAIKMAGKLFAIVVPLLFALVPLFIHFVMK